MANDNSQKPIFTNTIAQSSKYNSVNLMIDNIEVKVEDSRVIFTQAQDIGISSCVVYVGLVGEIKKRIGSINASVETHLDNGEYAFDIEIDGLVHRSGVFRIGKVPESVEVLNKSEKEIGQLQPKDKFLDSTILQLRQASEMLKEGIITKQEFDKIKDRLIQ